MNDRGLIAGEQASTSQPAMGFRDRRFRKSVQNGSQGGSQGGDQDASQSADSVGQVMGDVQEGVGLINGVYQLLAPAILQGMNKRNERASLKRLFGPWFDRAFEGGFCRIPVLDNDRFELHLRNTKGVLTPQGSCTANTQWGHLLHALAIYPKDNPKDDVLTWKPAQGASWDMRDNAIAIDIRGRAFCHLINLYRVEAPKTQVVTVDGNREERMGCRLSFGWLTWTTPDADHAFATFEPDTIHKLDGPKYPLQHFSTPLDHYLWNKYEAAWSTGLDISDFSMLWPNPQIFPLHIRLQSLVINMWKLRTNSHGVILTQRWLSNASSIRRRAMTNGGKDNSFLEGAYTALVNHPIHSSLDDHNKDFSKSALKDCFLVDQDFEVQESSMGVYTSLDMGPPIEPREVLRTTLQTYSREDPKSWKGQLYAAKDFVVEVGCMSTIVECSYRGCVRVLDFANGDLLWEARVHL